MIKVLAETKGDILGVEIVEAYTKEDFAEFVQAFEQAVKDSAGKVNLLVRIDKLKFRDIEFKAFVRDSRYALEHIGQLGRVAIVGSSKLEKFMVSVDNLIFGNQEKGLVEKYFDASELDQAWAFVRG
jgi:hypothetical protein